MQAHQPVRSGARQASFCFVEMLVEMSIMTQEAECSERWYVLRLKTRALGYRLGLDPDSLPTSCVTSGWLLDLSGHISYSLLSNK